jgi:hypothetical protein
VFSLLPTASWLLSDESAVGRTARSVPGLAREVRQQYERAQSLRGAAEETRSRLAAKRRVAVELAEGRLTLPEAAARLRELSAGESDLVRACRSGTWDGAAGDEAFYRQAVAEVRRLPGYRHDRAATLRRLEAELDGYLKDRSSRGHPRDARG